MAKRSKGISHTAYDDAFRTVETECDDALIPFVNHVFGEHYDGTARITRLRNEYYIEHEGKPDEKRITDAHFRIEHHGEEKDYQIECESSGYSESILIRLFQYAVLAAMDDSEGDHARIIIRIPRSGLLVLRDKGVVPKNVTFELHTPGGNVSYDAPVICEANYTLDEIFEQKLYFLLPFYFFNLESRMDLYETDKEAMQEFVDIYSDIIQRVRDVDEHNLSLRSKGVIIKHIERVTKRLAQNHTRVRRKVGTIMGGKVVKLDWLERFDAAVAGGREEGRERQLIRQICRKLRKGKSPAQIADELEEDEAWIQAICNVAEDLAPDYDEEKLYTALHTTTTV